jgi:hypothetical protein
MILSIDRLEKHLLGTQNNQSSVDLPIPPCFHLTTQQCHQSPNPNLIKCSHLTCENYSHLLCSRLHGFMITNTSTSSVPSVSSLTPSLHYECPNHYTVPQFCVCHSSLVDDDENKIRCNQCYEWYHPRCLQTPQALEEDEFCCGHCKELPDLANIKSINLGKKERAEAIQRGNLLLLALHEIEGTICPVIDKIELLESYLPDFPTLQDAITNDATLAHRVYSSRQYQDALKASHEINDPNFYGLAPLLSQWEERLLRFRNPSIPETLLMEWCCSIDLMIQDLTLSINQTSFQNPRTFLLIQNLMKYLEIFMNRSLQPREEVDRINSIALEDHRTSSSSSPSSSPPSNIFSYSSQWVELISQLFTFPSGKPPSNGVTEDYSTLPPVTPSSMELLIKHGRNLLQIYDSIATWDLNDSFSWLQEINHLLSRLLDILESKWVDINNLYSKINKLFPFLLSNSPSSSFSSYSSLTSTQERRQTLASPMKMTVEELQELITEAEAMSLRSEILMTLHEMKNRYISLTNEIAENLKDVSTRHLPILQELESKIALFPVHLSEREGTIRSCIEFLQGLTEFPDFNSQNFLCQVRLTSSNYETFLQDQQQSSAPPEVSAKPTEKYSSPQRGRKRERASSKDLTTSPPPAPPPPPLQEKIRYDVVMSFLESSSSPSCPLEYFDQEIQIYFSNLHFLSSHLQQLLQQESLQRLLQYQYLPPDLPEGGGDSKSHYHNLQTENILNFLLSQQEAIEDFSHQLSKEYFQSLETEYELKYLLSSIQILIHYLMRQQQHHREGQEGGDDSLPLPEQDNCQTLSEVNEEMNQIHEIINYSESSSSLLLQTIGEIFQQQVIPNLQHCLTSYDTLGDYLDQILYTDECSVTLPELKSLFFSVYFILNLKDTPPPPEEQHQQAKKKSTRGHHQTPALPTAPRTFDSLKRIIGITEQLEEFLKTLPSIDIQLLHEHVQHTKEDFLTVFPSVNFDDFENILTIIYRLPLSQHFKESITR